LELRNRYLAQLMPVRDFKNDLSWAESDNGADTTGPTRALLRKSGRLPPPSAVTDLFDTSGHTGMRRIHSK
jgi:hypothetical protein